MYEIMEKEMLNSVVQRMVVHAPFVAKKCEPGQFIILRISKNGERVPLTIADFDREKETVDIVFQVLGSSTKILSNMNVGDKIVDFVGPLGKPSNLQKHKRVLGIAGGVGSAPLYPQIRKLAQMGVKCDVIIGGRTKELCILGDKFKEYADNIYYSTDDGSYGTKGVVTDVFNRLIEEGNEYDEVITIGPLIMMKFVVLSTKKHNIPTTVSLNPIMIDGTGMCGCCRVTIGDETKFACVDGPDFDGFKVDFDEVMRRQMFYKDKEKSKAEAVDKAKNSCAAEQAKSVCKAEK